MADPSIVEVIWPGLSALLGAVVGGGATLWANSQKHTQEQKAGDAARKQAIKDRSFAACVDVLRTAQLLYNETNGLWFSLANDDAPAAISVQVKEFELALRNHHAANAVARMAVPPTVKSSFDEYIKAVRQLADRVYEWRIEHQKSLGAPISEARKASHEEACKALQTAMVEKRDIFARTARNLFAEDVWND